MAMKEYSMFPKALALLELQHQIVSCHIQDTRWEYLPLCKDAVGVFYSPSRLSKQSWRIIGIVLYILNLNNSIENK